MEPKKTITTIDEYIFQFPLEIQDKLQMIRKVIKDCAPDAAEKISYQMPAFELNGILVYFAAFKNHISFFPTASGVAAFKEELLEYKGGRGTIQFPNSKAIPYELISRIVKFRVAENKEKAEEKRKKKK